MFKLSNKLFALLCMITAMMLVCFQAFSGEPVLSKTPEASTLNQATNQATLVATATAPPTLERAVLGGKPVYVLYVTRAEDTVLIRCYPTYEPAIAIRAMGSKPDAKEMQKEGVLTCRSST